MRNLYVLLVALMVGVLAGVMMPVKIPFLNKGFVACASLYGNKACSQPLPKDVAFQVRWAIQHNPGMPANTVTWVERAR